VQTLQLVVFTRESLVSKLLFVSTMAFFRCSCALGSVLVGFAAACTAPIESDSLPTVDPPPAKVVRYEYQSLPDMPKLRPPLMGLRLLATNPDHPRWAVSDGRRLWIADDDGLLVEQRRVYPRLLRSIRIDHEGALWLLEGDNRLTRVDVDGDAEEVSSPLERIEDLVIGAKRVVLLGYLPEGVEPPPSEPGDVELDEGSVLAISDDGGREWQLRRRPWNQDQHDELRIAPDGSMQLVDGYERSCGSGGQERWTGHLDRLGWKQLDWPFDAPFDRYAGADGWSYAYDEMFDGEAGFHAAGPDGEAHLLSSTKGYAFVHDGHAGVLLTDDGMWSVAGREITRIGDAAPVMREASIDAMAIAHDGTLVITYEQSIVVGAATGWRSVELD
jgi:hypothetical protein